MHIRAVDSVLLVMGGLAMCVTWWACERKPRRPLVIRNVGDLAPALVKALARYKEIVGRFPTSAEGLQSLLTPPSDVQDNAREWPLLKGGRALLDPWGNPFQYESPGTHNRGSYDLWCDSPPDQNGLRVRTDNWSNQLNLVPQRSALYPSVGRSA